MKIFKKRKTYLNQNEVKKINDNISYVENLKDATTHFSKLKGRF